MRTTVNLNEEMLKRAQALCHVDKKAELINLALETLIEKYAAIRLAELKGSEKNLLSPPRRR